MLIIEKVVKLMDDYHFNVFREYVKNISVRSYYPLALIDVINRDITKEQDSDDLCKMVYSENDEKAKKKFFQLAHYTFKLTNYLAKNYPHYLSHNISLLQRLINEGNIKRAEIRLEALIEIAEKIEDFDTLLPALQLKAHKEVLENDTNSQKTHLRIEEVLDFQTTMNNLFSNWRNFYNTKGKLNKKLADTSSLDFLKGYNKNKSEKIKLFSRFHFVHGLYLIKDDAFYTDTTLNELVDIEKELQKNDFLTFPFLVDLNYLVLYLKLHYLIHKLDGEGILDASYQIIEYGENILFWKNFVNVPEIFSIAMQTSHYASLYMTPYKENHIDQLPISVKKRLEMLKNKCHDLIENKEWDDEKFAIWLINLKTIYSGLLLLGDAKDIKKSIRVLEGILISYQQLPFQNFIDPIYTNLIIGYFSLQDHEQVESSYRRYKKVATKNVVNPENDLTLHGFYYASKWLETGRNQYVKKLGKILEQTNAPNLKQTNDLLTKMVEYFKIEI